MTKIAIVVSHPIQHFCPQYTSWAKLPDIELNVFFASKHGMTPYVDRDFGRTVQWSGIVLDFPYEFLRGAEDRKLGRKIDSPDLNEHLLSFSPDVLIVYGYSQNLQRRALRWANSNNTPVLMIADSELRAHRNILKRLVKMIVLQKIYHKVSVFLTVGDANEAYYRHYGVADTQLVRCSFPINREHYDTVLLQREIVRPRVRNELGIPDHHKVILNVGKLIPGKRQGDLVRFSNALRGQRDDITIILVGTGGDEDRLIRDSLVKGAGGIVFAGFVSPEMLVEFYCAADIYAHCSEREAHSLAVSEAIYCGLPIVISDRCGSYGPTDDVRHGLNGYVYRCGDVNDLSQQLLHILSKDNVSTSMSVMSEQISRQHQVLSHGRALKQALAIIDIPK